MRRQQLQPLLRFAAVSLVILALGAGIWYFNQDGAEDIIDATVDAAEDVAEEVGDVVVETAEEVAEDVEEAVTE